MASTAIKMQVRQLQAELASLRASANSALNRLQADPARILSEAGMAPDPWQSRLLRSPSHRTLLLCSRQAGKSTVAAALALRAAILHPAALVLLLSPTLRQSGELFRDKVMRIFKRLNRPIPITQESALQLTLANGSRIISLPGNEETIRGYSGVTLLIVDEASRVPDELYYSVRPMLSVSRGQLVCLSTPFGQRGWFYDSWMNDEEWNRVRIEAADCPRITAEFLAEERRALGDRWYRQEYECCFEDVIDAVFSHADVRAALRPDLTPLFLETGTNG